MVAPAATDLGSTQRRGPRRRVGCVGSRPRRVASDSGDRQPAGGGVEMARHPLHDVAIVGVYNTVQARVLPDQTSLSISVDAAKGVMADPGIGPADIDGVIDGAQVALPYELGMGPVWRGMQRTG